MADKLYFNENVENPAIVYSINTLTVIKVGDKSYIRPYYEQLQAKLNNITEEEQNFMASVAGSLGLTKSDMQKTMEQMKNEYQYLEIPKDEKLLETISTQSGLRGYLVEKGILLLIDDDTDLQTRILKEYN